MREHSVVGAALIAGLLAACATDPSASLDAQIAGATDGPSPTATAIQEPCDAAMVVGTWPLRLRAAQLITVPVLNFDFPAATSAVRSHAGGVLLLGSGAPPRDLADRIDALTAMAGPAGPPFVMADQEGGDIQRLRPTVPSLPWPRTMARTMTPDEVRSRVQVMGEAMRTLGVTVDLAPVLDLDDRPGPGVANPAGERSFSLDPTTASAYGLAYSEGLRAAGILPVVKHFPGLGSVRGNTDFVASSSTLPLADLRQAGLLPFVASIQAGTEAVMISNAAVPGLTTVPASLSSAVIRGLLREELGFDGLVMTDSLSARSITELVDIPEASVRALAAGADMVLFGPEASSPAAVRREVDRLFRTTVDAIVKAVADGRINRRDLDASVVRILTAKKFDPCSVPVP
ncbi:MAG: glycoside hydrolase family 3 N-terminal domain-containing protein [Sporichthyaceae bacterium]